MKICIKRIYIKPDFVIESDNKLLLDNIRFLYSPFVYEESKAENPYIISVMEKSNGFMLRHQGNLSIVPFKDALQALLNILYENSYSCNTKLLLHAAAAGWSGKAYIFPADTFTGKSTLMAYLGSNGYDYITDDITVIDKSSFKVLPYPKNIILRKDSIKILKKYDVELYDLKEVSWEGISKYSFKKTKTHVLCQYDLGGIIFLERNDENINTFVTINQSQGFIRLMKSSLFYEGNHPEKIHDIRKIISCGCFHINFSSLSYVKDILKGHFNG